MKATITGNDSLSKRIILDLNKGMKVTDIPSYYPVTLDQTKKLSQFRRMLDLAKQNLEEEYYNRLQLLGIKSLPLAPLFRLSDWGGLAEILSVVTDETKRDELQLLIIALDKKRERIYQFKEKADLTLSELEDADNDLREKEKRLLQLQKEMNGKMSRLNQYPEPFRSFLGEYLGLYEGELVLAKRLNMNWQRSLQKEGMIVYDEWLSVFFVKDFSSFVEALISRHNRGLEYRWNPDKDIEELTQSTSGTEAPNDGRYKMPSAFSGPLIETTDEITKELKGIREKKAAIDDDLIKIKRKVVQSYMELTKDPDYLSTSELKLHKELQSKALKWLFNRGFIAAAGFTLPNGGKADIFAYNESQIIIFEIKVSHSDLLTDQKWTEYLPYCHEFFLLSPVELKEEVAAEISSIHCGQFIETASSIQFIKADERNIQQVNQDDELKFAAAQMLSRKFIYGY